MRIILVLIPQEKCEKNLFFDSLSIHKEGSKAFARYREMNDETKKEWVELLE